MLLNKGKITEEMIRMLSAWKHSGFNVFCGNRISPNDETAIENLARYIIRASSSQERMQYLDQEGKVILYGQGLPRIPIRGQKDKQELSRYGMAGSHVFPRPEQGRTDGKVLRIL
jgi:hypothetical protein